MHPSTETDAPSARRGLRGRLRVLTTCSVVAAMSMVACSPSADPTSAQPTPTSPAVTTPTTTAPTTPAPTSDAPATSSGVNFGKYPPKDTAALRPLRGKTLPATIAGMKEIPDGLTTRNQTLDFVYYRDGKARVSVSLMRRSSGYRLASEKLTSPRYEGQALCGMDTNNMGECMMAGSDGAALIYSPDEQMPVAKMAARLTELYKAL